MALPYINLSGRKTLVQAYQDKGSCNVCKFGDEMSKYGPSCLDLYKAINTKAVWEGRTDTEHSKKGEQLGNHPENRG